MPHSPAPGTAAVIWSGGTGRGGRFLIAIGLELLLQRHGWRVLGPAATVAAALRLLDGRKAGRSVLPEPTLLDINLRGELGTSVAEELRVQDVPFVLASAYDSHGLTAVAALAEVPNLGKPTRRAAPARCPGTGRSALNAR